MDLCRIDHVSMKIYVTLLSLGFPLLEPQADELPYVMGAVLPTSPCSELSLIFGFAINC